MDKILKSKIDLHLHTKWSDGEDSTTELLDNIIKSGVKFFSITDHDTIKGNIDFVTPENIKKLSENNIKFVTGIEVSTICHGQEIHVVALDYDINSQYITAMTTESENLRRKNCEFRIDYIENILKLKLSQSSKEYLHSQNICAKPHYARCLVNDGYSSDIMTALSDICSLLPGSDCNIDAEIVIPSILKAGGIPVWAHPLGGINEPRLTNEEFFTTLNNLIKLGLKGIECYYSLYNKEEIDFLLKIAKENNLYVSSGSDYHGKNVKKVTIGEVSCDNTNVDYSKIDIIKHFK